MKQIEEGEKKKRWSRSYTRKGKTISRRSRIWRRRRGMSGRRERRRWSEGEGDGGGERVEEEARRQRQELEGGG